MTLQAEGNYAKARSHARHAGRHPAGDQAVLDRLTDVPVDIEPRFTTADALLAAN